MTIPLHTAFHPNPLQTVNLPDTFTAIDFETAHPQRWSACAIGLVRVEAGRVVDEIEHLIQPPENRYWESFTRIHGIAAADTAAAPAFADLWPEIASFIAGQHLVAHSGHCFDFPVLRQTLAYYGLPEVFFHPHCTYALYRKNLADLCREHAIPLQHHQALSDAKACAELFLRRGQQNNNGVHRYHEASVNNE